MRIIVLGGSFNPPTKAHRQLLLEAVRQTNADKGLFLPASYQYVDHKMSRTPYPDEVYLDEQRMAMLNAMCQSAGVNSDMEPILGVSDIEFHRIGRTYTYESLKILQKQYPNAEICFLVGSDKLTILPKWHKIHEFLRDFKIIVADRSHNEYLDNKPENIIRKNELLSKYADSFLIINAQNIDYTISSTTVRKSLRNHDLTAQNMVTPEVWNMLSKR